LKIACVEDRRDDSAIAEPDPHIDPVRKGELGGRSIGVARASIPAVVDRAILLAGRRSLEGGFEAFTNGLVVGTLADPADIAYRSGLALPATLRRRTHIVSEVAVGKRGDFAILGDVIDAAGRMNRTGDDDVPILGAYLTGSVG
jgi:hypothetical protein